MSSQQWYLKVESRTLGPLTTDLVLRGLAEGELPSSALVCRAGAYSWLPLSSVPPFSRGTLPPPAAADPAGCGGPSAPHVSGAYAALTKPGGLQAAAAAAFDASRADTSTGGAISDGADRERMPPQPSDRQLLPPPKPAPTIPSGTRGPELAPVPGGLLDSDDFSAEDFSDDGQLDEEPLSDVFVANPVAGESTSDSSPSSGPAPVEPTRDLANAEQVASSSSEMGRDVEAISQEQLVEAAGFWPETRHGLRSASGDLAPEQPVVSLTDEDLAAFGSDTEPLEALQPLLEPDEPMVLGDPLVDAGAETLPEGDVTGWRERVSADPLGASDAHHAGDPGSGEIDAGSGQVAAPGSDLGSGPRVQREAELEEPLNVRITPTFMLSVSTEPVRCVAVAGEDEVQPTPPAVQDIDESDFTDVFEPASGSTRPVAETYAPAATLRSSGLPSSHPVSSHPDSPHAASRIIATSQVVISEQVAAAEVQTIGAVARPEAFGSATSSETAAHGLESHDREGMAVREHLVHAADPSVLTGQTLVIDSSSAAATATQGQTARVFQPDNPFVSESAAELEPSAWARADDSSHFGRNGSRPQPHPAEGSVESETERSAAVFDWSQQFCGYFEVGESFELPDQTVLVRSLAVASLDVLVQPEAMWNLAVCLALGSDTLARAAAEAFFRIMMAYPDRDRLDWMARVLLSRGFLPSGIPLAAGERAVRLLEAHCPAEFRLPLSEVLAG